MLETAEKRNGKKIHQNIWSNPQAVRCYSSSITPLHTIGQGATLAIRLFDMLHELVTDTPQGISGSKKKHFCFIVQDGARLYFLLEGETSFI